MVEVDEKLQNQIDIDTLKDLEFRKEACESELKTIKTLIQHYKAKQNEKIYL